MTRDEFINGINEWWELIDFCNNEDCDICEDIYDEDERDDYINSNLYEIAEEAGNWCDLKETLEDIPTDDGYYLCNGWTDWDWLDDDDFRAYKNDVLEWMDDNDMWDDEEDEEYDEEFYDEYAPGDGEEPPYEEDIDPYDLVPLEEEDISVSDLFSACGNSLKTFTKANKDAEKESENDFKNFVAGLSPMKSVKGD